MMSSADTRQGRWAPFPLPSVHLQVLLSFFDRLRDSDSLDLLAHNGEASSRVAICDHTCLTAEPAGRNACLSSWSRHALPTGAATAVLGAVAGCQAAVGAPLAGLAQQHCQLSAQLAAAQQAALAVQAQAQLQQRMAAFDTHLASGGPSIVGPASPLNVPVRF